MLLHLTGVRLGVLAWAGEWQPGLGLGAGAAGLLVCALARTRRGRAAAPVPAHPRPGPEQPDPPRQFAYQQPGQRFVEPPRYQQAPPQFPPQPGQRQAHFAPRGGQAGPQD